VEDVDKKIVHKILGCTF